LATVLLSTLSLWLSRWWSVENPRWTVTIYALLVVAVIGILPTKFIVRDLSWTKALTCSGGIAGSTKWTWTSIAECISPCIAHCSNDIFLWFKYNAFTPHNLMKKVYKIITLGDQSNNYDKLGVGKTSIVEAYINNRYSPVV
jgi:hypothetical protein